jgi:PAS domain S-box-containing protein
MDERAAADETERSSGDAFRAVVEQLNDAIIVCADDTVAYANRAAVALLGAAAAYRIVGRALFDCVEPACRADMANALARASNGQVAQAPLPLTMLRVDGRVVPVDVTLTSVVFERRRCVALVLRDVSAWRETEAALREAVFRFRTMAETTADWEYWVSPEGTFIYSSPACLRMTGYSPEELLADPGLVASMIHPDERRRFEEHKEAERAANALPSDQVLTLQGRFVTRSGEVRWVEHACRAVIGPDGRSLGRRVSNRDVTERKRLEDQLHQTEETEQSRLRAVLSQRRRDEVRIREFSRRLLSVREEEKQRLSAVLHHDVGSIAVAVTARMNAVSEYLKESDISGAEQMLEECRKLFVSSVHGLKRLAADLRPPNLDLLGLPAALREHLSRLSRSGDVKIGFSDSTRGDVQLGPEAQTALFRAAQEALNNAVEHAKARRVRVRLSRSRFGVRLTVSDDGCGFEPGATPSKPRRGLGLEATKEMVAALGGRFEIASRPGFGTVLTVFVPEKAGFE